MAGAQTHNSAVSHGDTGKIFMKVIGLNLLIFLVYVLLGSLYVIATNQGGNIVGSGFSFGLFYAFWISLFHSFILLIIGIVYLVKKDYPRGSAYLVTAIILPIIGFGACLTAFSTGGFFY